MPTFQAIDGERVLRVAPAVRDFLEPRWDAWRRERGRPVPPCPSAAMCRFLALFLTRVLAVELPEGEWLCVGGDPADSEDVDSGATGGYADSDGQWHGPYWVSVLA
jgi:hypothetical protein